MVTATIAAGAAARRPWDAIVVGAGPAGAFAARALARTGARVLLVDRQQFPRPKVCGGCLNGRTLALLAAEGLGGLPSALGGQQLHRFELNAAGRPGKAPAPVELPMPPGIAVSRAALDAALVEAAVAAGADFLPGARATLGAAEHGHRAVRLPELGRRLTARVVLAADGLAGSFLAGKPEYRSRPDSRARIGAGTIVPAGPAAGAIAGALDHAGAYRPGVIHMAVDRSGYVGVTRVEAGMLSVAAALDRQAVRAYGVAGAIGRILELCGLPAIDAAAALWRGTATLTRRAPADAPDRVFRIGDAAGYVEPFTGEGISWALETALLATGLAPTAIASWHPDLERRWRRLYRRRIARRQRWCAALAWALRKPALVRTAAGLLNRTPRLAAPLMAHLNEAPAGERR